MRRVSTLVDRSYTTIPGSQKELHAPLAGGEALTCRTVVRMMVVGTNVFRRKGGAHERPDKR